MFMVGYVTMLGPYVHGRQSALTFQNYYRIDVNTLKIYFLEIIVDGQDFSPFFIS